MQRHQNQHKLSYREKKQHNQSMYCLTKVKQSRKHKKVIHTAMQNHRQCNFDPKFGSIENKQLPQRVVIISSTKCHKDNQSRRIQLLIELLIHNIMNMQSYGHKYQYQTRVPQFSNPLTKMDKEWKCYKNAIKRHVIYQQSQ